MIYALCASRSSACSRVVSSDPSLPSPLPVPVGSQLLTSFGVGLLEGYTYIGEVYSVVRLVFPPQVGVGRLVEGRGVFEDIIHH